MNISICVLCIFGDFGTKNLKLESVSLVKTGVWTPYLLVDINNITINGVPITYGKERLDIFSAVRYATHHLLSCGITERETDGRHTALDVTQLHVLKRAMKC
jgi:hypothetical protein